MSKRWAVLGFVATAAVVALLLRSWPAARSGERPSNERDRERLVREDDSLETERDAMPRRHTRDEHLDRIVERLLALYNAPRPAEAGRLHEALAELLTFAKNAEVNQLRALQDMTLVALQDPTSVAEYDSLLVLALTVGGGEESLVALGNSLWNAPHPVLQYAVAGLNLALADVSKADTEDIAAGLLLNRSVGTVFLRWRTAFFRSRGIEDTGSSSLFPGRSPLLQLDLRLRSAATNRFQRDLSDAFLGQLGAVIRDDRRTSRDRVSLLNLAHLYHRDSSVVRRELVEIAEQAGAPDVRKAALAYLSAPLAESLQKRLVVMARKETDPGIMVYLMDAMRHTGTHPPSQVLADLFHRFAEGANQRLAVARVAVSTAEDVHAPAVEAVLQHAVQREDASLFVEVLPRFDHRGFLKQPSALVQRAIEMILRRGTDQQVVVALRLIKKNDMHGVRGTVATLLRSRRTPEVVDLAEEVMASLD